MKRVALFALIAVLVAGGILFAIRRGALTPHPAVATLLPKDTVALVHLPDLNRMRDQWHSSDIYKLYQEPAMQDFLRKPMAQIPKRDTTAETLRDVEQLEIKDGFAALTSIENNNPVLLAGFRFGAKRSNAETIIGKWLGQISAPPANRQKIQYEQHEIEVVGEGTSLLATVYDRDWFFAANNVDQLKVLLDRTDGRLKESPLEQDENFRAAMAHLPANYAACFYVQPKGFADKLATLRGQTKSNQSQTMVEQIRGVSGALRFDGGKLRDTLFVAMPKQEQGSELTRSAAALGTGDTVLYLVTLLNVEKLAALNQDATPVASWLQKVFNTASRSGITIADWKEAFNLELGALADWPQNTHWPSAVATLPVKDRTRASKLVNALTFAIDEDGAWTKTNKDGTDYFTLQNPGKLLAITPTLALSDKLLVAGVDPASVESAIDRSKAGSSGLDQSKTYKSAIQAVPEPGNFFAYVDLPVLYQRLDASLRPMLLMAAMFMPAVSRDVDLTKLPEAEVVAKHLSPIVSSQRYDRDGYVTESVGPITLGQLVLGVAIPATFWWKNYNPSH